MTPSRLTLLMPVLVALAVMFAALGIAPNHALASGSGAVTSVAVPANGTYEPGNNLDFTVNWDASITVDTTGGTPRIALTIGASTRYADYISGSGSSALVFRYTVAAGDNDPNGIAVGALGLNGGSLTFGAGDPVALTLNSVGSTAGVLVASPGGALAPATNLFGSRVVADGPSAAQDITLTSSGDAALTIAASGITLSGADSGDFTVVSGGTCAAGSTSLATNASCTIAVAFDPSSGGAKAATLNVVTNAGTKTAALSGTGTTPAGAVSPQAIDFGSAQVGTAGAVLRTVTVSSAGTAALTIPPGGITVAGAGAAAFSIAGGTCVAGVTSLASGQDCTVDIGFTPGTAGNLAATLSVQTNDGAKVVSLSGAGTPVVAPASATTPAAASPAAATEPAATAVVATSPLGIRMASLRRTLAPGRRARLAIRARNVGTSPVAAARVCVSLPAGLAFASPPVRGRVACMSTGPMAAGATDTYVLAVRATGAVMGRLAVKAWGQAPDSPRADAPSLVVQVRARHRLAVTG